MGEIRIRHFVVGAVGTNCYCVYREGEKTAAVVDPADMGEEICKKLAEEDGLQVEAILLTHGHFDHILGCAALKEASGAKIFAPAAEKRLLSDPEMNHSALYGRSCTVTPDTAVEDGDTITAAGITFRAIATPGHTEGGMCYYVEEEHLLFSGDTLFCESVGRTDLPTGDMDTLEKSIRERLFTLPDDTRVFPGHMGETSIGHEKRFNPFV